MAKKKSIPNVVEEGFDAGYKKDVSTKYMDHTYTYTHTYAHVQSVGGYIMNEKEPRSKRMQILIRQSVYEELEKLVSIQAITSKNDLINQLIENWIHQWKEENGPLEKE